MKRCLWIICLFLVYLLVACSGPAVDSDDTSDTSVSKDESQLVYLPDAEDDSDNLIFRGMNKDDTTDQTEEMAVYQDVSDKENAVAIPASYSEAGQEFTAHLRLCGKVELCALDMRVRYDTTRLKYQRSESDMDDLLINCDQKNGVIYINFARISNLTDRTDICGLTFMPLSGTRLDSPLSLEIVEAVSVNERGEIAFCPTYSVDGIAFLNYEEPSGA